MGFANEQAAGYINLALYENSIELLGTAKVKLPDISYLTAGIEGAGIMGKLNVPLLGMVESMSTSINFLTVTQAAANLGSPGKHLLDLRVAEEFWEVQQADVGLWAEKYVMLVHTKSLSPGTVAPMSAADVSGEFEVYYYAAYKKGKRLWEIDKRNMRCFFGDKDYTVDVRQALGKI